MRRTLEGQRLGFAAVGRILHFLDDSRLLVAAGRRLLLLSAENGAVRDELTLPGAAAFVVTPDRREALVGTPDGAIHRVLLPDLKIKRPQMVLDPPSDLRMAISPEGSLLAATTQRGTRVVLLDPRTLEPIAHLPSLGGGSLTFLVFDPKGRHLAFGDSNVILRDLALVRDELASVGLAWDQATPSVASAEKFEPDTGLAKPRVPVIRPGHMDPAEFEKTRGLVRSGFAACRHGRFAAAVVDLQRAIERLQALRQTRPGDPLRTRQDGIVRVQGPTAGTPPLTCPARAGMP